MEVHVAAPSPQPVKHFSIIDWASAIPSVAAALFGIWAVHRLTKGREREKLAFDLYRSVGDQVAEIKDAAVTAWKIRAGPERRRAVAETKWRLQQLGSTLNRLHTLTGRRKWNAGWPLREDVSISLTDEMVTLRRLITSDPFEEPKRRAKPEYAEAIEQATGAFLTELDYRLHHWMR